jgi:hypothetical protein
MLTAKVSVYGYSEIMGIDLSEENERGLVMRVKEKESIRLESNWRTRLVTDVYKMMDIRRSKKNEEREAGLLLVNSDLTNYETSRLRVLRTSFLIEYVDICIHEPSHLIREEDS